MKTSIRIYVGTYAKYNAGSIAGTWLDLSDYASIYEFYHECKEVHKDEDDPEFMFQDFEGPAGPASLISESWINEDIYEIIETIEDYDDDEDFVNAVLECMQDRGVEDVQSVLDEYQGEYKDDEDFAYHMADDLGYLQGDISWPYTCIDWQHAARELMYDYASYNGFYFRNY